MRFLIREKKHKHYFASPGCGWVTSRDQAYVYDTDRFNLVLAGSLVGVVAKGDDEPSTHFYRPDHVLIPVGDL